MTLLGYRVKRSLSLGYRVPKTIPEDGQQTDVIKNKFITIFNAHKRGANKNINEVAKVTVSDPSPLRNSRSRPLVQENPNSNNVNSVAIRVLTLPGRIRHVMKSNINTVTSNSSAHSP